MNLHPNLGSISFDMSSTGGDWGFVAVLVVKLAVFFVFFCQSNIWNYNKSFSSAGWLKSFPRAVLFYTHSEKMHHLLTVTASCRKYRTRLDARLVQDWSGHGHFSDKVYFSIQVLICALGNIWGCGWGIPVWLAEAVNKPPFASFSPSNHA